MDERPTPDDELAPWEGFAEFDPAVDDTPVTRSEFRALIRRIEKLEAGGRRTPAPAVDTSATCDAAGNIPRGKYVGKPHEWVVTTDPWYVQWLSKELKAAGLGFTEEQERTANEDRRPDPGKRR